MATKIQKRRDTAANWTAVNPVLAQGEEGLELDTGKEKVGNGTANWNSLPYKTLGITPTAIGAATAAQGAKADTAIQPGNAALSDAREWSADTISQAEAEAGTATTRRAFTAARVFQAVAAWWAGSSAKTKLDGVASGATANSTDAQLRDRATHTGTQPVTTITGLSLGTAAPLDVAATGDASATQVVKGNDSRLSDSRTPTVHTQAASTISDSTTAGRALLTAADAAAQRTALGLGTAATAATGDFAAASHTQPASTISDSTVAGRALLTGADATAQRSSLGLGTAATAASTDFLPTTFTAGTLSYAATTDLDMSALAGGYRTLSLTGNVTFTTSNRASGRQVTIRILCDATQRTLTFPAGWVFVGTKPSNIAASKTAVLSLTFFGTTDADCVAAYGVQS